MNGLAMTAMPAVVAVLALAMWAPGRAAGASPLGVDNESLVSEADLIYAAPVEAPVHGQPIGNGRMGTLVWTSPGALHLQINRNDVFAVDKSHGGAQHGPADYCGACAKVDIEVGGQPFEGGPAFAQRLSLHDAEASVAGSAIHLRCFVAATRDVLALETDDRRPEPQPVRVTISMWREPEVVHDNHVARYEFVEASDAPLVVQRFEEGAYHCASAVAARIVGGRNEVSAAGETARTVIAPARAGKRTILISSAASWAAGADVGRTALKLLGRVGEHSYDRLRREHTDWWRKFWSRSFVDIASDDEVAQLAQRVRYLHLYHMASSSRGALPPKWNGSIFTTEGDARAWGSQFWVWTTEMLYFPLFAADATDLMDPYFDMYVRQLPACEEAAVQRWDSRGAHFPETGAFDGPVVLPQEAAAELREVLSGTKAQADLPDATRALFQFDGHLFVVLHPHEGRYAWISHLVSSGSELAVQAWWRYRYTGDTEWLRTHAYPLLRGTVEFYRHFVRKGEDGKYHIHGTNAHEDFWGVKDSIMDLAAIRGTAPLAIRAAETLDVDEDLRSHWQGLLDDLAPYPMGSDPESVALTGGVLADDVWAAGHLGDIDGQHNPEDVWLNPVFPFEDWTLETRHPAADRIVQKALDLAPRHASVLNGAGLNTAIRTPIAVARAGRGQELPAVLASYYAAFSPLPNGMSLFEGANAQSIEHLGLLSTVLHEGLLQSVSPRPGEPEVISVFPAWPREWDASFRLLARGGFEVTSAIQDGEVQSVEIRSRLGERCRLRNPWEGPCSISEAGGPTREHSGDVLRFRTRVGGHYRIAP